MVLVTCACWPILFSETEREKRSRCHGHLTLLRQDLVWGAPHAWSSALAPVGHEPKEVPVSRRSMTTRLLGVGLLLLAHVACSSDDDPVRPVKGGTGGTAGVAGT